CDMLHSLTPPCTAFLGVGCVHCNVQLTQPGSMTVRPGESLTISCKVSGYSLTDSSYATNWIRQPAGKELEWVGVIWYDGSIAYKESLKNKFTISRDTSSSTVSLQGKSLQTEDTAVYYCARRPQ
uniref:Ig-like domain-containing protein n=1 Tax=Paramormyrops kingsleyae TaxID=1676925 RepID=A0A3B3QWF4_9TELE